MTAALDNEYQDSTALGSLVGALGMWRTLLASKRHADPHQLTFAYVCPGKIEARALAAFLREGDSSAVTAVGPQCGALAFEAWQVQGITRREVQSLPHLERLLTRLRLAGAEHGSNLVSLAL